MFWLLVALATGQATEYNSSLPYVRPLPRWKLETKFRWEMSAEGLLWNKFSQRELCTIKPQQKADSKLSLREHCQFTKIQSEIRSKLKSQRHAKNPSALDATAKSNFLKTLPQCDIGFIKYGFWVETARRQIPQCVVRGTQDRVGYQFSWADLPLESSDASIDLARDLTRDRPSSSPALASSPTVTTNLVFLGDSVSTQLAQFLICDLARAGVPSVSSYSVDLLVKGFTPSVSEFHFTDSSLAALSSPAPSHQPQPPSSHHRSLFQKKHRPGSVPASPLSSATAHETKRILRIHSAQFNLPCIHTFPAGCESLETRERLAEDYLTALVENYTHFSSPLSHERTVIVLNYGLHLRARHSKWAVPGMVRAYLRIGRRHQGLLNAEGLPQLLLLYRETSSQVFTSNNCEPSLPFPLLSPSPSP
jgi:hypothetical protein